MRIRLRFSIRWILFATFLFAALLAVVAGPMLETRRQLQVARQLQENGASIGMQYVQRPGGLIYPRFMHRYLKRVVWVQMPPGKPITLANVRSLHEFDTLQNLNCLGCRYDGRVLAEIAEISSLRTLNIGGNPALVDDDLVCLREHASLRELEAFNVNLTLMALRSCVESCPNINNRQRAKTLSPYGRRSVRRLYDKYDRNSMNGGGWSIFLALQKHSVAETREICGELVTSGLRVRMSILDNQLTKEIVDMLAETDLQELSIFETTDGPSLNMLEAVSHFLELRKLSYLGRKLPGDIRELYPLQHLRELGFCKVEDLSPDDVQAMQRIASLRMLYLHDVDLSDESIRSILHQLEDVAVGSRIDYRVETEAMRHQQSIQSRFYSRFDTHGWSRPGQLTTE